MNNMCFRRLPSDSLLAFNIIAAMFIPWSVAGQNTFPASGSVGIGTSSPSSITQLQVAGSGGSSLFVTDTTSNFAGFPNGIVLQTAAGAAYVKDASIGVGLIHLLSRDITILLSSAITPISRPCCRSAWPGYPSNSLNTVGSR